MTTAYAFWVPALAVTASTLTTQLTVAPGFQVLEVYHENAAEMFPSAALQATANKPAASSLHHAAAMQPATVVEDTGDIWKQLRTGFAFTDQFTPSAQARIDRYRKQARQFEQILRRGAPYLSYILSRVEARGLPAELALLPVIESAFDPFARSPAGAAGIWQFMPATASEAGLRRDWWFDGRRDIVAATEAALDYLARLHQRYDGDWLLALAAYNAGSARVSNAIRNNRRQSRPADFWHLALAEETRNYVPKLIALRAIIASPAAHEITLPDLPGSHYFTVVDVGGQIDLQVAARLAGTSFDELQRLNPGLIRSITPPDSSHQLLVPRANAQHFREQLALLPADQRVRSVRYRVRPGDTLSHIAQNSRTTVSRLLQINQLESSRIVAGKLLIVPVNERDEAANESLQLSVANG